ncbi:hypothetical protein C8J57DRAFT_1303904 [Mycena rebaudengoi]|nr:hypothetical protein C8J57DRAFT_1303904 [Mycena rebaudengoi]
MSDFTLLTGPILLGTQFNWALLGTLTLQVYNFHVSFPQERTAIKALVYTIFLLDVLQTALSSHFVFGVLVTGWGNPDALAKLPWTNAAIPVITALVSCTVQIFFAWRIYALKQGHWPTVVICSSIIMLALLQSAAGMAGGIKYVLLSDLPTDSEVVTVRLLGKIWILGNVICDVVIAAAMVVILSQYRKATPWKTTDSLITKLIYHTVETSVVTAAVAILDLGLFFPTPYYPGIPLSFIIGKIYSNVMMANINARKRVEGSAAGGSMQFSAELRFVDSGSHEQDRTLESRTQVSKVPMLTNETKHSHARSSGINV